MPSYSRAQHSLMDRTIGPKATIVPGREGETERAELQKKRVIQLVIRPPLTDEMISECPKISVSEL